MQIHRRELPLRSTLLLTMAAAAFIVAGCSSTAPKSNATATPSPSTTTANSAPVNASATKIVKSRDGKFDGEVIGTPAPDSKFAKLAIGMQTSEVQEVMDRTPDRSHSYESGKRWIPFYFGNDARRMQVLYKGEGCLIFTGGNIWGASGGDLIQIQADPSGACYQP